MRVIHSLTAIALALFLFVAGDRPAFAQQGEQPLSDGQVEAFIGSYPEAKQLAEKYELDQRARSEVGPGASPTEVFAGVIDEMKAAGAYPEFDALVRRHGFASAEEWVSAANRIMMAYAVMSAEEAQGGGRMDEAMAQQLAEARQQIQASDMPADQKQMAMSQLEAMAGQVKMFDVSEADRDAVRPHMAELDGIVETD